MHVVNLHGPEIIQAATARGALRPVMRRPEPRQRLVVLVDERALTLASIGAWLTRDLKGYEVRLAAGVGEVAGVAEPHEEVALVICHIGQQRLDSPEVGRRLEILARDMGGVPVAVMSDHEDVGSITTALNAGVRGYIPTSLQPSVAVEAVRLICAGDVYAPTASLLRGATRGSATTAPCAAGGDLTPFSPRQLQIIRCLRRGMANKMIAYELTMSQGTVKVHIRNIMKKLGARNRTQVVMMTADLFGEAWGA